MQLKMIGRKYFNPKLSQKFHEIRLEAIKTQFLHF